MKNKNNSPYLLLQLITLISIFQIACNRVPGENQDISHGKRIVCVSKQYNEIIFALHADSSLVGVDLSSTFPPEIKKIPSVGYHRALSTEGILSVKPDLIIHDNNIGPDHVLDQLQKLKIPMRTFGKYANTMEGTDSLIREISKYYHKEIIAEQIIKKLDFDFKFAIDKGKTYHTKPRVLIIHYGQASNQFLIMTNKSVAASLISWAGGEIPVIDNKGMKKISAEIVALSDPDVILLTDFGYDKLGSEKQILTLPGVSSTKAATTGRIYRVEENKLVYIGPRTGKVLLDLQKLIHQ